MRRTGEYAGVFRAQPWPEDDLIREHYPGGGAMSVEPHVGRSRAWIARRASFLGVKMNARGRSVHARRMGYLRHGLPPEGPPQDTDEVNRVLRRWPVPAQLRDYTPPHRRSRLLEAVDH